MQHCWMKPSEQMKVGLHTREICWYINHAMDDLRKGKSTFLIIKVPFRHGKSDIISRYLPPHFLGEFPDKEVMIVTYAASLALGFSRFARGIIKSDAYKDVYPDINIAHDAGGVEQWGIGGSVGVCTASGLTSGITGKGYHLGILDDFCGSRADAESQVIRDSTWDHFTNDFLTRRAPVSITIILATPWHVDDIIGRCLQKLNKNNENYDPEFPQFNVVTLPAMSGDVDIHDYDTGKLKHVKYEYLFPERFSPEWYKQQRASLGEYGSASLLQCNPQIRGGRMIKLNKIQYHDTIADFPKVMFTRFWDLAHTEKQTQKNDPDWTSGTLLTYTQRNGLWELWIKDVGRFREDAPQRDRMVRAVTDKDGQGVPIVIESSLDSKDAYKTMREILMGKRIVQPLQTGKDKVVRMSPVLPIFEAGNVHILRGEWNYDWLHELNDFPSGAHDDQVDNISAGFMWYEANAGAVISTSQVVYS
jgi:predicted phage terminase large subunit-like protein